MRAYLLVAVVLLSGCGGNPIRESWLPADHGYWEHARKNGARLNYPDGTHRIIPSHKINSVILAKERLERVSGVKAELALIETDSPNAFAIAHDDRKILAISLSMIDAFSKDWDALATTIGHELAHLHLGHLTVARKEREDAVRTGEIIGAAMNLIVPWSGTLASAGVTAYARSFNRDEERAADEQGIKWAIAAGYDPCGHHRVVGAFQSVNVTFLSNHPGYGERSDLANEYAIKATGKPCEANP